MQKMQKKNQDFLGTRLDILFFYLFLVTSILSIRKVIFYFPIQNSFNEYSGVYIYLSDVLLILTFIFFILYNNKSILSNIKLRCSNLYQFARLFHVEQCNFKAKITSNTAKIRTLFPTDGIVPRGTISPYKKAYAYLISSYLIIFPLFISFFSFISIAWSTNKFIATYRSIKLLELIFLYFFIYMIAKHRTNSKKILGNIFLITIIIGVFESIIGIIQFIIQHSLGFLALKESIIGQQIPGVAKIIFHNHVLIRAYGLFPHPNIFGGYLVFSIVMTLLLKKLFVKKTDAEASHVDMWSKFISKLTLNMITLNIILSIQCIALLLTFSKSAILGLSIALFCIFSRENFKLFHVEQFKRKALLIIAIVAFSFILAKPDIYSLFIKSLQERNFYLNVSRGTLLSHPFIGVGAGQFVFQLLKIPNIQSWQFQPVHNVFLLIANEYGLFIALGFILFLLKIFFSADCSTCPKCHLSESTSGKRTDETNCSTWNNSQGALILAYLKGALLAFIFIMMFDHYFWDIQQGQILLWILLGLLASLSDTSSKLLL